MADVHLGRLICCCDCCHYFFNAADYPWCKDYAETKDKTGHRIHTGWHVPRRCPNCKKEVRVNEAGEKKRAVREATDEEIKLYDDYQREILERVYDDLIGD